MKFTPLIEELIESLKILPGVGPKSAQRIAFGLLERQQKGARRLSSAINSALQGVCRCQLCRNFSEHEVCDICHSEFRQESAQICVVASPMDLLAIEDTGHYKGRYFVLMGLLSPIDGIGPQELGLNLLEKQLMEQNIEELILATSPSVEGEATAYYISEIAAQYQIKVTRLAQGLPSGGELASIDGKTLGHAFSGRKSLA
ncbi:recombination mediator RecR [Catenovulum sp. 2E275]|uniref:recombination mediator RecR n=1 Tax=Catenovulum sp. 2E275 TaxID=2980497 RepID=UPI0021D0AF32|nr:recombination mediator RecR [Catenovulum sp. 2E275]MCU4674976.1 recombination mediator RecR [Catenovulum sp. 2E275]